MTWRIRFQHSAAREFRKLDPQVQRRIRDYLQARIVAGDNPRRLAKALRGRLRTLWRYRGGGNFRLICDLNDQELTVLVVRVGHRGNIYD